MRGSSHLAAKEGATEMVSAPAPSSCPIASRASAILGEAFGQAGQARLRRVGQEELAVGAAEEGMAQMLLELAHLLADGGGGHVQLRRRLGEAQMAGGDDEGAQSGERRQTRERIGHEALD